MKTTKSVLGKALVPAVVVLALGIFIGLAFVKTRLLAAPTPPATTTACDVVGAPGDDGCYQQPFPCFSTQAFWLSGLDANIFGTACGVGPAGGTDGQHFIFTPGQFNTTPSPGTLTEFPDGHATLTGHIESTIHPGNGFNVNIRFDNFTATDNGFGPLLELNPACYGTGPGKVDVSTWHYYQNVTTATLTGTGNYAGAVVQLIPIMGFPQFGNGASGKNIRNGASGWFNWNVTSQPGNPNIHFNTTNPSGFHGDFNIECNPCTGRIGDFVWQDNNGNGCQDAGEPGIQGVQVDLFSGCGANKSANPIKITTTDGNGAYSFTGLCAGNYTVCFHTPSGFNPTIKQSGTCASGGVGSNERDSDCSATDCNICVNLPTDNSQDITIDCGYIPVCTGKIGDFVWQDNNGNGCQDAGEPGIQGVQVDLFSGCGANKSANPIKTTTTGANGQYLFTNLCAGNYTVCFHTPTGFNPTIVQSGTCASGAIGSNERDSNCSATDCNICVNLPTDNSQDLTIDCGYIPVCTGKIGDFVWEDDNSNGCQDANEPGIPNVQVDLFSGCGANRSANPIKTTTTGANGQYLFTNLCAGNYTVCFHTPNGFTPTIVQSGTCASGAIGSNERDSNCAAANCEICVNLPFDNSQDLTIDCGYIPPNRPSCLLTVTKSCVTASPTPAAFNCSNMKPITTLKVIWNGNHTVWVRAWNGTVGGSGVAQSTFGPIANGQEITWTRTTASTPNDIFFEVFSCAAMTAGCKDGTSTFHLSCSDVDMNGPEDCGKAAGNGKTTTITYINTWIFNGMSGANNISINCGSSGGGGNTTCVLTPAGNPDCKSAGKPTSLTFQYTGGGCAASNNPQSGKFTCSGSVNTALPITVSNANGYAQSTTTVSPGGFITFSKSSFNAQSGFTLSNSGGTENLSIHTSCSQVLAVGNVFGDLTLVGFNGQTAGNNVTYHYTVTNNGNVTLTDVNLDDDKIGHIAGPFSLTAGQTKAFDAVATVTQNTTNTATASANGGNCSDSSNSVTVTVPSPTPTPTATPGTGNCANTGGKKPTNLTMTYTGNTCASSANSQGPPAFGVCQKFCCTESNGGLTPGGAHIIVSSSNSTPTGTSQRFFEGDVNQNGQFNVPAGSKGFGANTYFFIYQGGVSRQMVQLHTSCSAPLRNGETFGGVRLDNYSL